MRKLIAVLMLGSSLCWAQKQTTPKCYDSPNQGDLNNCAAREYKTADNELNALYKKILRAYAKQPDVVTRLKAAQKAWVRYRDAQLEAQFPSPRVEKREFGSVYPMCYSMTLAGLTRQKTNELRMCPNPAIEGDLCAGCVGSMDITN